MAIPETVKIMPPWIVLDNDRAKTLEVELTRELSVGHVLQGGSVTAVAVRVDRDDVTFEIDDGTATLALVHLTWQREASPEWPKTTLFADWEQWVREVSMPSHDEYTLRECPP